MSKTTKRSAGPYRVCLILHSGKFMQITERHHFSSADIHQADGEYADPSLGLINQEDVAEIALMDWDTLNSAWVEVKRRKYTPSLVPENTGA